MNRVVWRYMGRGSAVLSVLFAGLAFGQVALTGTVLDLKTQQPLEGVQVSLESYSLTYSTGDDGSFQLRKAASAVQVADAPVKPTVSLSGRSLRIRGFRGLGPVQVSLRNALGKEVWVQNYPTILADDVCLNLSSGQEVPSAGILFATARVQGQRFLDRSASSSLAKEAVFIDTLVFNRGGYVSLRLGIENYQADLGEVKLSPIILMPPANISLVNQTCSTATLQWTDVSNNETAVKVERRIVPVGTWSQVGSLATNATGFVDAFSPGFVAYEYRVRTLRSSDSSAWSSPLSMVTEQCSGPGDAMIYQILVDRFENGNPGNDHPENGAEPAADFMGGDFAGVLAKLQADYFNDLGVNAILFSPLVENATGARRRVDGHKYASYQGVFPTDFAKVDSHYGSSQDFTELVAEMRAKGLSAYQEWAINHVDSTSSLVVGHQDWFWPSCVCGSSACSWGDPVQSKRCWFDSYLPDLNYTQQATRSSILATLLAWKATYGVDGLFISASGHYDAAFLEDLRSEVGSAFPLFGYRAATQATELQQFVHPATSHTGMLDLPLREAVIKAFLINANGFAELMDFLDDNEAAYPAGSHMLHGLGTVDHPRVVHFAQGLINNGQDLGTNMAWANQPSQPTQAEIYSKLAMAYAFLFTIRGIPTIFYGDEVGLAGGGVPDNHRTMPLEASLSKQQIDLRSSIAKLAKIRSTHPALRHGSRTTVQAETGVLVYRMSLPTDSLYIAMNKGAPTAINSLPAGTYRNLLTGLDVTVPVALGSNEVGILMRK